MKAYHSYQFFFVQLALSSNKYTKSRPCLLSSQCYKISDTAESGIVRQNGCCCISDLGSRGFCLPSRSSLFLLLFEHFLHRQFHAFEISEFPCRLGCNRGCCLYGFCNIRCVYVLRCCQNRCRLFLLVWVGKGLIRFNFIFFFNSCGFLFLCLCKLENFCQRILCWGRSFFLYFLLLDFWFFFNLLLLDFWYFNRLQRRLNNCNFLYNGGDRWGYYCSSFISICWGSYLLRHNSLLSFWLGYFNDWSWYLSYYRFFFWCYYWCSRYWRNWRRFSFRLRHSSLGHTLIVFQCGGTTAWLLFYSCTRVSHIFC